MNLDHIDIVVGMAMGTFQRFQRNRILRSLVCGLKGLYPYAV